MLKKILSAFSAAVQPEVTTAELIEEIHNEFNTASSKAVEEANRIINDSTEQIIGKGSRLQKLGFKNTGQAKEAELKGMLLNFHCISSFSKDR